MKIEDEEEMLWIDEKDNPILPILSKKSVSKMKMKSLKREDEDKAWKDEGSENCKGDVRERILRKNGWENGRISVVTHQRGIVL